MSQVWCQKETLYHRFVAHYQLLNHLSRRWRRALRRVLGMGLAAAALALALGLPLSFQAAAIQVDGVTCTLAEAITAANTATFVNGCLVSGTAAYHTIDLDSDVTLAASLPEVTSQIILNGNNHFIDGDNAVPLFAVGTAGDLTIHDAILQNGYIDGNGAGINVNGGAVTLNSATISGNQATTGGGGLYIINGTAVLNQSIITGNTATVGSAVYVSGIPGGGVTIRESTISDHSGGDAIRGQHGYISIESSTISNNGRAIYAVDVDLTINNSTISNNNQGVYFWGNGGEIAINNSTIAGNNSFGIRAYDVTATINNSTISSNGTHGIEIFDATLILNNNTITGNSRNGIDIENGAVTLNLSLVSGNTLNEIKATNSSVTSDNYNVIGYNGSARSTRFSPGSSDIIPSGGSTSVLSTTLANNGGATWTHSLVSGSPAIDMGPSGACVLSPINHLDQRGYGRLVDADGSHTTLECDIGAVEYGAVIPNFAAAEARLNGVDCALVDAIISANTDTAVGNCAAGNGDDTITLLKNSIISGATLPSITSALTIDGADYLLTGSYNTPILDILASGSLTLTDIALMGGHTGTDGGILTNQGALLIHEGMIVRGYAADDGGAIFNQGSITVTNSLIGNNEATDDGGAIFNQGSITVTNSVIENNESTDDGGAILSQGSITVTNSVIKNNEAIDEGGGINLNGGTAVLNKSTITGNKAISGSGINLFGGSTNLTVKNSTITDNNSEAIAGQGGTVSVVQSLLSGNKSGTYLVDTDLTVNDSTISNHSGGGIYFWGNEGSTTINNSTIVGNNKYGMFAYLTTDVTVNNSTISGNGTDGVELFDATVVLNNVTITQNSKNGVELKDEASIAILNRSLISGNGISEIVGGSGTIIGNNYNVVGYSGSDRSTNFTPNGSDIIPTGAITTVLDTTLADHGGPTETHALVAGSMAIDVVSLSDASCNVDTTFDQRGVLRADGTGQGGAACDVGAFEYDSFVSVNRAVVLHEDGTAEISYDSSYYLLVSSDPYAEFAQVDDTGNHVQANATAAPSYWQIRTAAGDLLETFAIFPFSFEPGE